MWLAAGKGRHGAEVKIDFLMERGVFIADHKPPYWIVVGNQEPEAAGLCRYIEDKWRREGIAGAKRLNERGGRSFQARERSFAFDPGSEGAAGIVDEDDAAGIGH